LALLKIALCNAPVFSKVSANLTSAAEVAPARAGAIK
jgi:hypothetical protein